MKAFQFKLHFGQKALHKIAYALVTYNCLFGSLECHAIKYALPNTCIYA